jgi:ligand-binding sensor domain-containing protein
MKMKYWLMSFLMILMLVSGRAQNIAFEHLSIESGLSQVSVTSLLQDDQGRIWIGTRDGLNVYDGSQTSTFRPIRGNENTILGHNVRRLKKDRNFIWAATNRGVSRLDIITLKF